MTTSPSRIRIAVLELLGAAAAGTATAALWVVLGTAWTWAVDAEIRFTLLNTRASALIALPAFAMGWLFFLLRRAALRSRREFVGAALMCAAVGATVHRALFFDAGVWELPSRTFRGELDLALEILVRRATTFDLSFLAPPADVHLVAGVLDPTLAMSVGSVVAAGALAAAFYSSIQRWLTSAGLQLEM